MAQALEAFGTSFTKALGRLPWQRLDRHRRPIALAASVGIHILLVLCLLPHSQRGFSTGGQGGVYQGEGEGLSLDLTAIALPDALAATPHPVEEVALDGAESLDALTTATDTLVVSDAPSVAPSLPQPEAARQGGEGLGGTSSGTFDDLWAAIAPCWRRIADKDTLPVNLTVSFAGNGMLAKPPEIVRAADDASNFKALRSESLAIAALAECGTYQMAAGRENVSIQFPMP